MPIMQCPIVFNPNLSSSIAINVFHIKPRPPCPLLYTLRFFSALYAQQRGKRFFNKGFIGKVGSLNSGAASAAATVELLV